MVENVRYSWHSMESFLSHLQFNDLLDRYNRSQLMMTHAGLRIWLQTLCMCYPNPSVVPYIVQWLMSNVKGRMILET